MKLDSHGKLATLEIIVYVPVGLFCIYNNIRHGFRREAGWIYLTVFCISMSPDWLHLLALLNHRFWI